MCHLVTELRTPNNVSHKHLRDAAIPIWYITNIFIPVTNCESVYINCQGVATTRHVITETEIGCYQMPLQYQILLSFGRSITNDDPFISCTCSRWRADIY